MAQSTEQALRRGVIQTALEMNRLGINQGKSGNVSARAKGGFFVTPSGIPYDELMPENVSFVRDSGEHVSGMPPSSEWQMHLTLLRLRPKANAVVHAHPIHATALSCMGMDIPAFHYMVAAVGGDSVPCAEYATFGTEALALNVARALQDRKGCLMSNHGIVAIGETLGDALRVAENIEVLARTYIACLGMGKPRVMPATEMTKVLEKFKTYGVKSPR